MMRRISTRLRSLFTRGRMEQDLDRELAFHLDMLTEQHVRAGMSASQARQAAMQHFGAVDGVKDAVRDTWLSRTWETLGQDIRYGLRSIRRTPGFALVVIVTMALGIGANTAIFSVVNAVLLRPLPYDGGDRVVALRQQRPLAGENDIGFSALEIADYAKHSSALESISEFHSMWFILLGRSEPERVSTGVVSANFFETLGVKPMLGRPFALRDEEHGAPAVLILSHKYWKTSFGGDPTVVGRVFQMNDRPHEVVGVLPPVPQYPEEVDVYMPTSACPFRAAPNVKDRRDGRMMSALGRIRTGIPLDKARADLDLVTSRMQQDHAQFYPTSQGFRATATPLQQEVTQSFQTTLLVLLGTAGFVLLIVCASIANLTLARMVRRDREMSVRAALGASRTRLVRQLLTESTLLAVIGGALGLAVAGWGVQLLATFAERYTTRADEISIDGTVLLFTFVVSIATGLIFGSVPAAARKLGSTALREGGRSTHGAYGLRSVLIVAQVAVSFMLLIGAGLTVRTLYNLQQVDPGIRTDDILTMRLDINFSKYATRESRNQFWERLDERLRAIPGVASVGGAGTFPLNDQGPFSRALRLEGVQYADGAPRPAVDVRFVSPGYFETLGQSLVAGRYFRAADRGAENPVVIVNRKMAQHYWPNESAIGRRISGDDGRSWATIVGVVADARQQLNEPPKDEVYSAMFQIGQLTSNWLLRTEVDAATMTRQVREAIYSIDPQQPADRFRTLSDVRASTLESPRLTAILIGLFAMLALVITAAGMAGVIALSVNQRTQEFGLRMALGAQRGNVLGMVLRQGLQLVLIGLAIGLAGSLVLARLMTTLLFGVEPTDAVTFVAVSAVLVAVAAIACFVPARRAATVDPMVALRVGMLLLVFGGGVAGAQQATPSDALDGVDTVVLLTQGKEVFGKEQFRSTYGRFAYLFSSAETKAQFDKAPEKYAIQMGGLCARMGKTVTGNPSDYVVHDGKIYIFGSDACHQAFVAAPSKFLPRPAAPMPRDAGAVQRGRALLEKAATAVGDVSRVMTYVETSSQTQRRPTGDVTIVSRNMWKFPDGARSERRVPMADGKAMTFGTLLTSSGAWSVGPDSMTPAVPEALPSVQLDFGRQIVPVLRARNDKGVAVAALGPATVQGANVERVRVLRGGADVTLNIDPATGRIHSTSFIDRGPGGEIGEFTVAFSDFRSVSGLTLPFKETSSFNGVADTVQTRTLDEIAVNGPLDTALFSPPVTRKR